MEKHPPRSQQSYFMHCISVKLKDKVRRLVLEVRLLEALSVDQVCGGRDYELCADVNIGEAYFVAHLRRLCEQHSLGRGPTAAFA